MKQTLKYRTKSGFYSNYCNNVRFFPDKMIADSYQWWVFVKKIGDKVVFNNYSYSHTTSKHQIQVRDLLDDLGIKVDIWLDNQWGCSSSLDAIRVVIRQLHDKISEIQDQINSPRTHRLKNVERQLIINDLFIAIKNLKEAMKKKIQWRQHND